ncbi:MAG: glycosyltransferase [Bacteroidetes bacterium]|nr:glycosyltransferase [Bacteroidota bacterium]
MRTDKAYHFLFFGLTSFRSLPQREQALALECARLGHEVDFIEIAPSVAGRLHALSNRLFSPLSRDEGFTYTAQYPTLRIHTPPTLPTGFRNSLTPAIDRALFRRWFNATFRERDLSDSIVMVMMPLWWGNFIDRDFLRPALLVYDICDSLEVQARSAETLSRLRTCERALASEADLITYSAREMEADIRRAYPQSQAYFIPNAVSREFIAHVDGEPLSSRNGQPPTIGYIGSTSGKWFDAELVLAVARALPECTVSIVGPVDRRFTEHCRSLSNIELHGYVPHAALAAQLRRFDVAIIPFLDNEITRIVNPLKLYEYSVAGLPIVARRTEELAHYAGLLYLADTQERFISEIRRALEENDPALARDRRLFAERNTWEGRVRDFLQRIQQPVLAA